MKWICATAVCLLVTSANGALYAGEDYVAFLRALQRAGYGDIAIDYLKQIEKKPDLPAQLKESIDLEYANCLWAAAASAYDDEEAQKLRAEAQKRLDDFIKNKPNHPAVADAMATWGDMAFQRGLRAVYTGRTSPDAAQKKQWFDDARKAFDEARPRFTKAEERLHTQYKEKKGALETKEQQLKDAAAKRAGGKNRPAGRTAELPEEKALDAVMGPWIDSLAKLALIDYWSAQTYSPDDKDAATRKKLLQSANKQFSRMHDLFRVNRAGVVAHLWRAKVHFELDEVDDSSDICEEVLANAPDSTGPGSELDPIFVEAQQLWLRILHKKGETEQAITEANQWLKANLALQKSPEYQGVALELVKIQLSTLANEKSTAKRRATQQLAMKMLTDIGKIRSEFQQEAILLKREISKTMEGPGAQDAGTFEEALALANSSADSQRWEEAVTLYEKALTLLEKHKLSVKAKAEQAADITERLASMKYQIARGLYVKKDFEKSFVAAEKIAHDYAKTSIAPSAAALAGYIALDLYKSAKDDAAKKGPALERLIKITDYTVEQWPGRAEADDARIALAQASIERGEFDKAIEQFIGVNVKSPRYPNAMLFAGYETWKRYRQEKAKPEKDRDAAKMAEWRANAEKWLKISIEGQIAAAGNNKRDDEVAERLADTQSMLAGIYMEAGNFAEAVKIYRPLIDKIVAAKPQQLPSSEMQLFAGTVRAYVGLGDAKQAADTAINLAQFTGDEPPVNAVLIDALRVLMRELQKTEATDIEARGAGEEKDTGATSDAVASIKQTLARFVDAIANRQQFPLAAQIYLGEAAVRAGNKEQAQARFNRVVTQAESDKEFATKNAAALLRVRAQLVGMLRDENKHAEALTQIDKLIEANPKSLDLLMQRGRILQDVATKQPEKYSEAVAHWTKVRNMLKNARNKPPELYEVIYYLAECLLHESQSSKNAEKAELAEQLLRQTVVLNPKLSGPDMVAKYNVLMKKASAIGGPKARE